jgi:hypothetical protein
MKLMDCAAQCRKHSLGVLRCTRDPAEFASQAIAPSAETKTKELIFKQRTLEASGAFGAVCGTGPLIFVQLILDGHRIRTDRLLSGNPFKSGEHAPVVVLVGLKCRTALAASVVPGDADEMLLGLRKGHQCTDAE